VVHLLLHLLIPLPQLLQLLLLCLQLRLQLLHLQARQGHTCWHEWQLMGSKTLLQLVGR
jgi:hypothetical protein